MIPNESFDDTQPSDEAVGSAYEDARIKSQEKTLDPRVKKTKNI